MATICPKCGYERKADDDFPLWGCPKCGACYAKVEAHLRSSKEIQGQRDSISSSTTAKRPSSSWNSEKPQGRASQRVKRTGSKHGFLSQNLSIKQTIIILLVVVAPPLAYIGLDSRKQAPSQSDYDFSYKKSSNQYGVTFYRFNEFNAPPIELTAGSDRIKDIRQINQILEAVDERPISRSNTYEKTGRSLFVWENYGDGKLVIDIGECKRQAWIKRVTYQCIDDLQISPSPKQKMVNQAKNSKSRAFVSREQYGEDWPFTVDFGMISCRGINSVVFRTQDHRSYAVNGVAMSEKKYRDLREILRDKPDTPGYKVSIGPIIREGLSLCDM